MWTVFIACREAREFCLFYLKTIALMVFIFHSLISQGKCHELGHGKGYHCKNDGDCDKSRFLLCIGLENTCDCHKSKGMMWVPEENSCMVMEDAPCGSALNEPKCVTNSSCNDFSRRCECNDGFLRNGFGKCQLSYNSVCSESEKCADRYLLNCTKTEKKSYSVCKCVNEGIEFVWDENKQKCVSTAGGRCDMPGTPLYGKDDQLDCVINSICLDGICRCKSGFNQTPEGVCMLQFGEPCNSQESRDCDMHQFLVCRDKKCACQYYSQMMYDEKAKQCRVLAGESCHVEGDDDDYRDDSPNHEKIHKCVEGSVCKAHHGSHRGRCTCIEGMERQRDGTCSRYNKGYGLPCSTLADCDQSKFLECDFDEYEGSRCNCPKTDMYFDGKECRVRAGRNCTVNNSCANYSRCDGYWCVCLQGYTPGTTDCIPQVPTIPRASPNSKTPNQGQLQPTAITPEKINCDIFTHGSMERIRCNCQSKATSHAWIQEKDSCLALVGSNCHSDRDCIPYSTCDVFENTCQCSKDAHTTMNRTCKPAVNSGFPVGSHNHLKCTEMHTLSVRSQEQSLHLNSAQATRYTWLQISMAFLLVLTVVANQN